MSLLNPVFGISATPALRGEGLITFAEPHDGCRHGVNGGAAPAGTAATAGGPVTHHPAGRAAVPRLVP